MESGATLAELLAAALPSGPAALSSKQSAGAALALALHCELCRRRRRCRHRPAAGRACNVPRSPGASGCRKVLRHPVSPCPAGLMVRDGYVLLDRSGRRLPGATPPPGWNDAEHAWVFDYERWASASAVRQLARQPCGRAPAALATLTAARSSPVTQTRRRAALQAAVRPAGRDAAHVCPRLRAGRTGGAPAGQHPGKPRAGWLPHMF